MRWDDAKDSAHEPPGFDHFAPLPAALVVGEVSATS